MFYNDLIISLLQKKKIINYEISCYLYFLQVDYKLTVDYLIISTILQLQIISLLRNKMYTALYFSISITTVLSVDVPLSDLHINNLPRPNFLIPSHFKTDDVKFSLFTKNTSREILTENDLNYIDAGKPFKLIIHGWTESPSRPYYKAMTEAYLQKGDFNIIHVDWSKSAASDYNTAVRNTVPVGAKIGEFVQKLNESKSIPLSDIHLLGHSLGAHVAGLAGKQIIRLIAGKIERITGLDPAGPLYENVLAGISKRLDKNDANMVDVVHTDDGVFGYKESIGTVDFFPNGGFGFQPGCSILKHLDGFQSAFKSAQEYVFCSHMKSHAYYIESINSKKTYATKCKSWSEFESGACANNEKIIFGEDTPPTAKGNFYFKTRGFVDLKYPRI